MAAKLLRWLRFPVLAVSLGLALASCASEPEPPPTPTPDIEATVQAAVRAAIQTAVPALAPSHEPEAMEKPPPPSETMAGMSPVQEIALIENYAATQFFPQFIVVLKDLPVKIYLTRLHREHVNKFTIAPFYSSSEVILPGEIGVIEFVPDQVGEFKISNVGHNFNALLVVVETMEDARKLVAERGRQMYALIHSIDDFRIFPARLVVQKGIPATIHNISLIAEHKVSFEPFHVPEDINIRPRKITPIELNPDRTGEFTIRHELHGFTGELIVEENG